MGSSEELLERVTQVRGVNGAMLVGLDDGLVISEALMEGVRGNALAALATSLYRRFGGVTASAGIGGPEFVHLQASGGSLLMMPLTSEVLVVAVADPEVNVGLIRLEMARVVEAGV